MKVALFSDIHGNITGMKAVLSQLDRMGGADLLVAAGDIIGGGPGTDDLLDILIERKVLMVRGDNEEILSDIQAVKHLVPNRWKRLTFETNDWLHSRLSKSYRQLLSSLPLCETIEFSCGRMLYICHASPTSVWDEVCALDNSTTTLRNVYGSLAADVVAYGHAHKHHVLWLDSKLLLNVASVGLRKNGLSAFTLLEYTDERWSVQQYEVPYDTDEEAKLMAERAVPRP